MKVYVLPAGPLQTNAYLITAPALGEAALVDAPLGVWADVKQRLEQDGCELKELWLTHGHFDHIDGAAEVVRETRARVRAHVADQHLYEQPEAMRWFIDMFLPGHPRIEPVLADAWMEQGNTFEALGARIEVRHVPGHADGNIVFVVDKLKAVFVGDSLFAGSIGRTDLPGGSLEVLSRSIREQLYTLPEETVVFPGHGPRTTVGEEKAHNPYVR